LALATQPDHLPRLVRVWPSESAAQVVKACQAIPSVPLRKAFPLRKAVPHWLTLPSTGTRSYVASTAGKVSQDPIPRYLTAQTGREDGERAHHRQGVAVHTPPDPGTGAGAGGGAVARWRGGAVARWRSRTLDTTALEQRITGWRQGQGTSATRFQQEAERQE